MDITGNRKIFYVISGVLFFLSIAAIALLGLKPSIDFTGGSILEAEFSGPRPGVEIIRSRIENIGGEVMQAVSVTPVGERSVFIRTGHLSEGAHQKILALLAGEKSEDPFTEKRFDSIGPTIGRELRNRSMLAIFLVIFLIVLYIAWAFRKVSRPVPSWKYGVVTVIALFHDVILPTGLFVVLGRVYGVEVDTLFVTALLTILGFSVHDTIVVFDRIRENLKDSAGRESFEMIVNKSVNETMTRSINTSLTVILAMLAVFLFGGESVRFFSLALIAGIVFGTYSSIFIASPLLVTWHSFAQRKNIGS